VLGPDMCRTQLGVGSCTLSPKDAGPNPIGCSVGPTITLGLIRCRTPISFGSCTVQDPIACWVLPGAGPIWMLGLDGGGPNCVLGPAIKTQQLWALPPP